MNWQMSTLKKQERLFLSLGYIIDSERSRMKPINSSIWRSDFLTTIEKRFGMRIRELRMLQEISQEELAWRCQLSKNYVSDVERGRRNVSLKAIEKFAKGLDVKLEDLFR
jgi:ribosome-binding protein aMBF1 (putative translation factor)